MKKREAERKRVDSDDEDEIKPQGRNAMNPNGSQFGGDTSIAGKSITSGGIATSTKTGPTGKSGAAGDNALHENLGIDKWNE